MLLGAQASIGGGAFAQDRLLMSTKPSRNFSRQLLTVGIPGLMARFSGRSRTPFFLR
jgi:hypothetical protein